LNTFSYLLSENIRLFLKIYFPISSVFHLPLATKKKKSFIKLAQACAESRIYFFRLCEGNRCESCVRIQTNVFCFSIWTLHLIDVRQFRPRNDRGGRRRTRPDPTQWGFHYWPNIRVGQAPEDPRPHCYKTFCDVFALALHFCLNSKTIRHWNNTF